MSKRLTRLIDWMRWGASRFNEQGLFFGHGTDNAWDEAVYLVLNALHLPPETPSICFEGSLTESEIQQVEALFTERLNTRKPAAYLTHEAWFGGLWFYVDERVLIPRSPFAEVLTEKIHEWLDPEFIANILEIGTGSGCMAILAAHLWPEAHIDAVDDAKDALEVAHYNVARYGLQDQVSLIQADGLPEPTTQYDLIMTNPPYVSEAEWAALPPEYHHEPKHALTAERDGLAVVEAMLNQAAPYLTDHGLMVVEVGFSAPTLEAAYPEVPFYWLDMAQGGQGLFVLTKQQLLEHFGH